MDWPLPRQCAPGFPARRPASRRARGRALPCKHDDHFFRSRYIRPDISSAISPISRSLRCCFRRPLHFCYFLTGHFIITVKGRLRQLAAAWQKIWARRYYDQRERHYKMLLGALLAMSAAAYAVPPRSITLLGFFERKKEAIASFLATLEHQRERRLERCMLLH